MYYLVFNFEVFIKHAAGGGGGGGGVGHFGIKQWFSELSGFSVLFLAEPSRAKSSRGRNHWTASSLLLPPSIFPSAMWSAAASANSSSSIPHSRQKQLFGTNYFFFFRVFQSLPVHAMAQCAILLTH